MITKDSLYTLSISNESLPVFLGRRGGSTPRKSIPASVVYVILCDKSQNRDSPETVLLILFEERPTLSDNSLKEKQEACSNTSSTALPRGH